MFTHTADTATDYESVRIVWPSVDQALGDAYKMNCQQQSERNCRQTD